MRKMRGIWMDLNIRFRTDIERIRRILPPPLEPPDDPEVLVDFVKVVPPNPMRNIFIPGPYKESGMYVSAKYKGKRGMFMVCMPLSDTWGLTQGREAIGYAKKDGIITLEQIGDTITASCSRHGYALYRAQTAVTEKVADPAEGFREWGYGAFLYRYRLDPDWRRGVLSDMPVELWLLSRRTEESDDYPSRPMEQATHAHKVCDITQTKFEYVDPSPLDPCVEFPVREIITATFLRRSEELRSEGRNIKRSDETIGPISRFLEKVENRAFEPHALYQYDYMSRAWSVPETAFPEGWPERRSLYVLNPQEIEQYRRRQRISINKANCVELDWEIMADVHARTLPPMLKPCKTPTIRMLGIDCIKSEISPVRFSELWLMSAAELNGSSYWYLLAHIVGIGGDVIFGRETFGYPSKMGRVTILRNSANLKVTGERLCRKFIQLTATCEDESSGAHESECTVLGIYTPPFIYMPPSPPFSRPENRKNTYIVSQLWQLLPVTVAPISLESVKLELPDTPAPALIGRPDPWFELKPLRIMAARWWQGSIYRAPGKRECPLPFLHPYFDDRYDGVLSPAELAKGSNATFLVKPE